MAGLVSDTLVGASHVSGCFDRHGSGHVGWPVGALGNGRARNNNNNIRVVDILPWLITCRTLTHLPCPMLSPTACPTLLGKQLIGRSQRNRCHTSWRTHHHAQPTIVPTIVRYQNNNRLWKFIIVTNNCMNSRYQAIQIKCPEINIGS